MLERLPTLQKGCRKPKWLPIGLLSILLFRLQKDRHSDVLTQASELHKQQLHIWHEKHSAAPAELMEQHGAWARQEIHAQQERQLSTVNEVLQQHEQQLQQRHSAALTEALQQHAQQLQDQDLTIIVEQLEQHIAQLQPEREADVKQAAATFTSQLKQQQAQREDSVTQLKALHDTHMTKLEQECTEAQKAALKAEQAETEAHLTKQQSAHERDLADCRAAFANQVEEQPDHA